MFILRTDYFPTIDIYQEKPLVTETESYKFLVLFKHFIDPVPLV